VSPAGNQKRMLLCGNCGAVFLDVLLPVPAICPNCGSFSVKADKRVAY
jgi:predicted Zn-ribbon and HTH transcriptional regulator